MRRKNVTANSSGVVKLNAIFVQKLQQNLFAHKTLFILLAVIFIFLLGIFKKGCGKVRITQNSLWIRRSVEKIDWKLKVLLFTTSFCTNSIKIYKGKNLFFKALVRFFVLTKCYKNVFKFF